MSACRWLGMRLLPLIALVVFGNAQTQTTDQSASTAKAQTAQMTMGEKKAVSISEKLETNELVVVDQKGEITAKQKIDPRRWQSLKSYASKVCNGPVPISPRCVRCKNGEIICANVPQSAH